jgi:RHS repeat-associated protein
MHSIDLFIKRTFDADGAGAGASTSQYWAYDEGINAVLQFDGAAASNLSHRYLWSNQVDQLLADEAVSGGNVLWPLANHLGTIPDIADYNESTGITAIANHRVWDTFGKLISETAPTVDLLYGYTGKQYDEATGLQHNLNRWYDPALGQWLSEDPISFAAGDENLRRYVGNQIINLIDPTGLQDTGYTINQRTQAQEERATEYQKTRNSNHALDVYKQTIELPPMNYQPFGNFPGTSIPRGPQCACPDVASMTKYALDIAIKANGDSTIERTDIFNFNLHYQVTMMDNAGNLVEEWKTYNHAVLYVAFTDGTRMFYDPLTDYFSPLFHSDEDMMDYVWMTDVYGQCPYQEDWVDYKPWSFTGYVGPSPNPDCRFYCHMDTLAYVVGQLLGAGISRRNLENYIDLSLLDPLGHSIDAAIKHDQILKETFFKTQMMEGHLRHYAPGWYWMGGH